MSICSHRNTYIVTEKKNDRVEQKQKQKNTKSKPTE